MKNKNNIITKFDNFKQINEADLYDNQGIPKDYLNKVKRENTDKARNFVGGNIMGLVRELQQIQTGNEEQLEELAIRTFRSQYGDILDNVEIDAKIVRMGDVREEMEQAIESGNNEDKSAKNKSEQESSDESESESESEYGRPVDLIDPEVLKDEIDKRKISNAISQGESKNIHRIIHLPEVKDELDAINPRFVPLMDKLLKSQEMIEWLIPMSAGVGAMTNNPNGLSKAQWVDKPESEESEKTAQDIISEIENMEDINQYEEELAEMFDEGSPKIIVRAVDFPILLHEMTKAMFELIIARAIPSDQELASRVLQSTDTYEDEFDDLKYGVDMRRDLTNYILEAIGSVYENINSTYEHKNLKEFVFGNLLDTEYVSTKDFLLLTNIIFSTVAGKQIDPVNKRKADKILKDTILDVIEYLDNKRAEMDKYLEEMEEWEKSQKQIIRTEKDPEIKRELIKDMSEIDKLKSDLESAIDDERYEDAASIQKLINDLV